MVNVRSAVVVDSDLPLELLGPLGCGVLTGAGAVFIAAGVHAGSTVVVFGAGSVGLSAVMAARVAGATTVVVVDRHSSRLELALELGATHVVHARDATVEALAAIAGPAHYSFETTGVPSVITDAVNVLRARGVCGLIGVPTGPASIDVAAIKRGRTVMPIVEGDAVPQVLIPRLIELWRAGRFPFDRMIKTFDLSDINNAERAAASGEVIKPVLLPHR